MSWPSTKWWYVLLAAALVLLHTWNLDGIPRGLYVDETSIGHNAYLVITTGFDEHGHAWPVFFEAFGEYKNPLYVYTAGVIMRALSPLATTLRLTSTFYFFLLATAVTLLTWRLTKRNHTATLLTLLAVGTLPWFFTLSRVAFEVISHLTVIAWLLYLLYLTFEQSPRRWPWWLAAAGTGSLAGLSLYSYSTARLLTFILLGTIILVYGRQHYRKLLVIVASCAIVLLPYSGFILTNPGALTARFKIISYAYSEQLTVGKKISTFAKNYVSHITPDFLFSTGDANTRHGTGYGGVLYLTVGVVALIGIGASFQNRFSRRFTTLLLLNLAAAPIATALTDNAVPHALRSSLFGIYVVLFFGVGVAWLTSRFVAQRTRIVVIITLLLCLESALYLNHYFREYPEVTIGAFEGYDIPKAIDTARTIAPHLIVLDSAIHQAYSHAAFYRISHPAVPFYVLLVQPATVIPNSCVIQHVTAPYLTDTLPHQDYTLPNSNVKLRCWRSN